MHTHWSRSDTTARIHRACATLNGTPTPVIKVLLTIDWDGLLLCILAICPVALAAAEDALQIVSTLCGPLTWICGHILVLGKPRCSACRSCARTVAVSACRAGPRRSCSARRFPARGGDSHASRPAFLGKGRGAAPAQIMHPESHPIAALLGENAI